jgi:hypothetical protein
MLGLILYEGVDIMVSLSKITYNMGRGVYYWWKNEDYPEIVEKNQLLNQVKLLQQKVEELERKIEK